MGETLYLESYSGISGDMTVAALLDLGADAGKLTKVLESLPLEGFHTEITRVKKSGLDVCDFRVVLTEDNHDHDMEYLHGHGADHAGGGHAHPHGEAPHPHCHRGMREIRRIIGAGDMTERARNTAIRVFEILAEAEAEAHGVPVEEVHFHEVGAVDSIVDIVSAAVCLDDLDISAVIVPALCEGTGTIRCQHGIIPVPVPAVTNIVKKYGLSLKITDVEGELVTPTGAAIAAAVRTSEKLPEAYKIQKTGMGAGKREYSCPGILRAMLIKPEEQSSAGAAATKNTERSDSVLSLVTDIDDCTGETLGYVMERLYGAGAKEVHYTPVFMKKNRPAWELTVICKEEDRAVLEGILFRETTTIGIRRIRMERSVLTRRREEVDTPLGKAVAKTVVLPDGEERSYPEYESASALAREHKTGLTEIYSMIEESLRGERGQNRQ